MNMMLLLLLLPQLRLAHPSPFLDRDMLSGVVASSPPCLVAY